MWCLCRPYPDVPRIAIHAASEEKSRPRSHKPRWRRASLEALRLDQRGTGLICRGSRHSHGDAQALSEVCLRLCFSFRLLCDFDLRRPTVHAHAFVFTAVAFSFLPALGKGACERFIRWRRNGASILSQRVDCTVRTASASTGKPLEKQNLYQSLPKADERPGRRTLGTNLLRRTLPLREASHYTLHMRRLGMRTTTTCSLGQLSRLTTTDPYTPHTQPKHAPYIVGAATTTLHQSCGPHTIKTCRLEISIQTTTRGSGNDLLKTPATLRV